MTKIQLALVTHSMSIAAGMLGIIAGQAGVLGIPPAIVSGLGVGISVLIYAANQLPSLGTESPPAATPGQITVTETGLNPASTVSVS